jgi:hypothetical protein
MIWRLDLQRAMRTRADGDKIITTATGIAQGCWIRVGKWRRWQLGTIDSGACVGYREELA